MNIRLKESNDDSSFDSEAPFLLSQIGDDAYCAPGDVSTITSPNFITSRSLLQNGPSSLFARLSRATAYDQHHHLSPALDLSTIHAEHSTVDKNGQVSPANGVYIEETKSTGSFDESKCADSESSSSQRIGARGEHCHNVSQESSPAKKERHEILDSKADGFNINETSLSLVSKLSQANDEWREVFDHESERVYYYNRRTRISKWQLPKGAILASSSRRQESKILPFQREKALENLKDLQAASSKERSHGREVSYSFEGTRNEALEADDASSDEVTFLQGQDEAELHLKSPQDPTESSGNRMVFCMYCGLKCDVPSLGFHLSGCNQFAFVQRGDLPTQIELESTLFRAWSQINNSPRKGLGESHDTSNKGPGEMELGNEFSSRSSGIKTPERKKSNAPECFVEVKNCPFCEESFTRGTEFSSHLLQCSERRRARNQRRRKKKESPVTGDPRARKCTPGRRLPWE